MGYRMLRLKAIGLAIAVGAMLMACGGEDGGDNGGDVCLTEASGDRSTYPVAPYGTSECAVIDNHSFTTADGSTLSLGDIYADADAKVLLLTTSAGWCPACIEEQPTLEAWHNTYGSQGLRVVGTLFADENDSPVGAEYAANWINNYSLTFPVVADTEQVLSAYYDSSKAPMNMIINVATMQIVRVIIGADTATVQSIIEAGLQ